MKATAILILAALISTAASAQEQDAPKPDFSRENLQKFVAEICPAR
jgi:hypothetical protein